MSTSTTAAASDMAAAVEEGMFARIHADGRREATCRCACKVWGLDVARRFAVGMGDRSIVGYR